MATEKLRADITGKVWKIVVQPGQAVEEEETLLVMESMKMEIPVVAPVAGKVTAILVKEGQDVAEGQELAVIET